ncbi:uncharacterized protein MKZ38_007709 [Zalerion maritima]|uniref:Major facilitator superfamily transporter n=1 Tax=Zalerion maritima TaxID=339359 RepID=A0AAD5RHR5_9PEZI|nr:uncharacterized protein MKZ38_007709 [Zalerion maritima]
MGRARLFMLKARHASFYNSLLRPVPEKGEIALPVSACGRPQIPVRAILGHCLYRRVALWTITILVLLSVVCLKADVKGVRSGHDGKGGNGGQNQHKNEKPKWMSYPHLGSYYKGIKSIVPASDHVPDWPQPKIKPPSKDIRTKAQAEETRMEVPVPEPYSPYPRYSSEVYLSEFYEVQTCYLDTNHSVTVPDVFAYPGMPQGMPDPLIGSHRLLGIHDDVCFDRFGRYGSYGLGYSMEEGGTGEAMPGQSERAGADVIWSNGKVDYNGIKWGEAQELCVKANKKRFFEKADHKREIENAKKSLLDPLDKTHTPTDANGAEGKELKKITRHAVVIRTYTGFRWTSHATLNFRAMISELALGSGGEYTVHFLVHVKDESQPIFADPDAYQHILDLNIPSEFHSICTLWTEGQMRLLYPGGYSKSASNPSGQGFHSVYRSAHFPLQHFALQHPEYEHVWNWEMDMRYVGHFYEFFDRLGSWGRRQSRHGLWERSAKYYVPSVHGSWDNFEAIAAAESKASGRRPISGPILFAGRQELQKQPQAKTGFLPETCAMGNDPHGCGVGEEADLITLNPLFDAEESGWVFSKDVTGYSQLYGLPPRRTAIITASRLSRRLLLAMHEETWRLKHGMFSEMFPPTIALHHGLKAVYAPHPVYLDRKWPVEAVGRAFNGGRDGSSGGDGSPFDLKNEHNHKGASWYYHAEFGPMLWRRWLGFAMPAGRTEDGGKVGQGKVRGGFEEENGWVEGRGIGEGRMCLRSMLVHPVKWEKPEEESKGKKDEKKDERKKSK